MTHDDEHSSFFFKTFAAEVAPIEHDAHPDLDLLYASLQGDIAPDVQSKLSSHLATCEACRLRWKTLQRHMHDATEVHGARSRVPTLDAYVADRTAPQTTLADWLHSLFEARTFAIAASAAVLALALAVAIPFVRAPALHTSEQIQILNERVMGLQDRLGALTNLGNSIPNQSSLGAGIVVADLKALDWENPTSYGVQPGDNWEGIAERQLGDADLWPLVWLLNRDIGPPDAAPPVGSILRLPTPQSIP
jgi:nucleoid-associated protein YgaU